MKIVCLLPLAALIGCTPAAEEEVVENVAVEEEAAAPAAPALEMGGSYALATYRGNPVPASAAMTATISGDTTRITSPCANMQWGYELTGNLLKTTPTSGLTGGCAADGSTFENGVAGVITQANIAMDMNGLLQISGPGGVVELSAQ